MADQITGLWAAMATPLDATGAVDHAGLARHGKWLMEQGCDGLVPFGTTGEGTSFSGAERLAAAEALLKAGIEADRIALGTGCPAVPDTIALSRGAMALGLTHALVLPPYFYRDAPAEGLEDAFAAIIDGVGSDRFRLTAYHIPQVSGVAVPPQALGGLRKRYGRIMAGVKDSSGDFDSFLAFRRAAPEIGSMVGAEVLINRANAAGGVGTICGMVNLVPALVRDMFQRAEAVGAMQAACDLIEQPFIGVLKAALASLSGDAAWRATRAPLRPADPAQGARVAAGLSALLAQKAA